jgi:4-hydroxy-tetrahydrodipicolinate synthase
MQTSGTEITGVIPAVVTPITPQGKLDLLAFQSHLRTLAREGCQGLLIMGTTGEGPSLGLEERESLIAAALDADVRVPILAGTGTPSLADTIMITQRAYELGVAAVVVVPPYYYRGASEAGLLAFFQHLLDEAVPNEAAFLLYHIPQVTGVPIPFRLIESLLTAADGRQLGIKDSSGDMEHARSLCNTFADLRVFVGTDRLLLSGLEAGAHGCITATANVLAPLAVEVHQAYRQGHLEQARRIQARLTQARLMLEKHQPFAASLKALLSIRYGGESWSPRPPLLPLSTDESVSMVSELRKLELGEDLPWLAG